MLFLSLSSPPHPPPPPPSSPSSPPSRSPPNRLSESEIAGLRRLFQENRLDKTDKHYGWFVEETKYKRLFAAYYADTPLAYHTRTLTSESHLERWNLIVFRPGTSFFFTQDRKIKTILVPPPNSSRFAWPLVFIEIGQQDKQDVRLVCMTAPVSKTFSVPALKSKASWLFKQMSNVKPIENFEIGSGKKNKTGTFQGRRNNIRHQCVRTPIAFYNLLNSIFSFDFDPCPINASEDAMTMKWGRVNYVNPPFEITSAFAFRAVEQAKEHGARTVLICPVATNSRWFNELVKTRHLLAIVFLREGMRFDGYNKAMNLHLNLLLIGLPISEQQPFVWQLDAEKGKKRKIPSAFEHWPLPLERIGW